MTIDGDDYDGSSGKPSACTVTGTDQPEDDPNQPTETAGADGDAVKKNVDDSTDGGGDDVIADAMAVAMSSKGLDAARYTSAIDVLASNRLDKLFARPASAFDAVNALGRSSAEIAGLGRSIGGFNALNEIVNQMAVLRHAGLARPVAQFEAMNEIVNGMSGGLARIGMRDDMFRTMHALPLAESLMSVGGLAGAGWEETKLADLFSSVGRFSALKAASTMNEAVSSLRHDHASIGFEGTWASSLGEGLLRKIEPWGALRPGIAHDLNGWKDALEVAASIKGLDALAHFEPSAVAWVAQVSRFADLTQSERSNEPLLSAMLSPVHVHARFARRTARRLESARTDSERDRLLASLHLAGEQLLRLDRVIEDDEPQVGCIETDSYTNFRPHLLAPFHVQEELLRYPEVGDRDDLNVLLDSIVSCGMVALAHRLIDLVEVCNARARLEGRESIFKSTPREEVAKRWLPWTVATNSTRMGEVVDHLYFLLYEGAGSMTLRFIEGPNGVLKRDDCEVIWTLKYLRNKWLRHDIAHGSDQR